AVEQPGAGRLQVDPPAVAAGRVVGDGAALDGERDTVGEHAAAGAAAGVAVDLGIDDRRDRAARRDAAAVAGGGVVEEGAVHHGRGALGVLVAETAPGRAGEVVGQGTVEDGNRAVAGVADAAADAASREGLVVADDRPVHPQGRTLECVAHLDRVEPDAGAL